MRLKVSIFESLKSICIYIHFNVFDPMMVNTSCQLGSSQAPPVSDWKIYATGSHRGHELVFTANTKRPEYIISPTLGLCLQWIYYITFLSLRIY